MQKTAEQILNEQLAEAMFSGLKEIDDRKEVEDRKKFTKGIEDEIEEAKGKQLPSSPAGDF